MKVHLLGTKGEIKSVAPHHSRKSGVMIGRLLFDIGECEFLKHRLRAIFITHLHPDHAFFTRGKGEPCGIGVSVYAPQKHEMCPNIRVFKSTVCVVDYRVTPVPTVHSKTVKSQAYLIEKGKKRILYTGDMIWIEKKYHKYLKDLDAVITEASFIRKGGMVRRDKTTGQIYGHTGIPDLVKLFSQFTHHIIFMHFGEWFYKDTRGAHKKFQKLARDNNIKITVGYDGLEIKV
ncbi:MAG: hypothetical protein A2932_01795 [Candidatus Spechtbacteria bacterium RIFCSPLOWO2_01_FULL_46_10]|uniref:Metallo-beta-lactamase domain-containing protein n=1 Tax=Candidatus Spechtbacteria bacterium RIFCSPLOWO2_01_FULL_46_10 TaxID=1802163 RepID=A0A1G2HDZ5_9BACT|nr:MAG: hypothetical protein A2932_01795 [Candidatus Spechtbacteria bacterium RIFCSPLOWO2_01_FULL_46_10]